MDSTSIINALFLCALNFSFLVAGILLNSVVIISIWRSFQLRNKECYFMILVLSCFDLATVVVTHPVLIFSTILWSLQIYREVFRNVWIYTFILFEAFSMLALLTLNIERFLALNYPFFHQTAVTKRRLLLFQASITITFVAGTPFHYFYKKEIGNIFVTSFLLTCLFAFIYMNCKILAIAKSKHKADKRTLPSSTITPAGHEERKNRKINFKKISTCSLTVGCFLMCSIPQIIWSIWSVASKAPSNDTQAIMLNIWSTTFVSMNSTFNCLILFWRNSILRREGTKIIKCFRPK